MAFVHEFVVRFEDVDYARVVFFPNVFRYAHNVFEAFFEREVGVPYAEMLQRRGVAFPSVHAEADFKKPLHFGDRICAELSVDKLGETSIHCRYRLFSTDHALLAELQIVTATIELERFQSARIPDDVRAAFARHLQSRAG